jgi:tmRNA-binding protein
MYTNTLEALELFNKTKDPYFNLKISEIKKVIKIMLNNCRTRKLIFKKNEVDLINKITKNNIGLLQIKSNQEIYSNIPLINLNKYLSYLLLN